MDRLQLRSGFARVVACVIAVGLWGCPEQRGQEETGEATDAGNGSNDVVRSGDQDARPAVVPEVERANEKLEAARCGKIFECCSAEQRQEKFGISPAAEECEQVSNFVLPGGGELTVVSEAIREDRATFDSQAAELCAESYRQLGCGEWSTLEPYDMEMAGCVDMIAPEQSVGEQCEFDWECQTGACASESEGGGGERTCIEPNGRGEDCFAEGVCEAGLYCDPFESVCLGTREEGASCSNDRACETEACRENDQGNLVCAAASPICGA